MSDFKREARYYVIKIKDLTEDQDISLCDLLSGARIPCTDCVVVEDDWPNYDHTWATIQRVSDGTYDDPYAENERLRARVAELEAELAQAVPVGEIVTKPFVDVKFFENTEFGTALPEGTKLYTQPQPAHQGSVTEETVENWRHDSEELEALHTNFDDAGTPRAAQGGEVYSAWGRTLRFAEQQGSVPDVGAMADVLGEWVRNTTGTALTHVTLVDMVRVMLTAAPTPEAGQDVGPVSFGNGDKVVEVGLYAGKPAVFVAPAEPSGDPGELAPPTTGEDKHRLVPGEWLMTFPTEEQAYEVADALCGRPLKKLYESHSQPTHQGSVPEGVIRQCEDAIQHASEASNELPPINSTVEVFGGVYRSDDMQWMESLVYAHVDGKVLAESTTHAASFELYPMSRVRPVPQPPLEGSGDA